MSAFHTMTLFMPKHFKPRHFVPTLSSPYLHPFAAAAAACDGACRCHLPELLHSVYLLLTAVFTIDNLPNSISPSSRTMEGGFIPSVTVVLHFPLPFTLCFKPWLAKKWFIVFSAEDYGRTIHPFNTFIFPNKSGIRFCGVMG